jgi:hypothetical protein
MTTPISFEHQPIPDSFSAQDRFLVEATKQALIDGIQLERWCRDPNRKVDEFLLDLKRSCALPNKAYGYFSDVKIGDQTKSLIGVRQEVEFGKATGPNPEEQLKKYVLSVFLPTSHWKYPDGWTGGFTYEQMLYCDADGKLGRYPKDQLESPQNWTLIGTKYRWSLFTVFLHDFVVKLGPITKHLDEAASLVQHPDFVHIVKNPRPGYKLEVAFGYPFIDFAPIPNNFGFGPGKFDWAVKLFSFLLRDNNEVRCDMDFAAGARPKKVFDFGKHIPCPLYGTVDALQTITFGLYKAQKFHDWMDGAMVAQHARVHQALMEGAARFFAEWVKTN